MMAFFGIFESMESDPTQTNAQTRMSVAPLALSIEYRPTCTLAPHRQNARTHSKKQIRQIAKSIEAFGFNAPILIDAHNTIIAGHGRHRAAKLLGMESVPTVRVEHLGPDEIRAYVIADNKLAESAGWEPSILAIELQHLVDLDFDVTLTGFEIPEIDLILENSSTQQIEKAEIFETDKGPAVTRNGDIWTLGPHRLICGSSLDETTLQTLMGRCRADTVFTDPPYNVRIEGNVCGKGSVHHREFLMASGEMSEEEFVQFLTTSLGLLTRFSAPQSVHFVCMDWRHARELLEAANRCYGDLLNVCIWVKTNGGMGSLYRSQHEMVFVFRNGKGRHKNNIQLGRYGRNRTNVWNYPGVNTFSTNNQEGKLLALHPTVKPIALVADAILDCSARGDIVLDSFLGSGTTLLAAERVGRRCYGVEIDPLYVDIAVRRWQRYTGEHAVHQSGKHFDAFATAAESQEAK